MLNENYFNTQQKYLIVIQITIIMVFIPICFYYLLRSLGKVDSIMLSELSQRKIPLLVQAILIYTLLNKSITIDKIFELYFFFLGAFASTIAALLLSLLKIKASLHMLGISALTAFVIGLSYHNHANALFTIAFLVLMNGIIGSSRLHMKAHSVTELVIGFCSGLFPQVMLWYFWL
jgi:hypothetical protein